VARDQETAINSYITDMVSLEDHIAKALKGQISDLNDYPDLGAEIRQVHNLVEHHISDLRALAERRKAGGITETVKRAGAAVAGVAAGVIDLVRTEGLPKNLRDDYTAFSLATIGYAMLYTTAAGLGEREVAELAQQHLRDYAGAVIRLNTLVPASVIRYLREEGLPVQESVLSEVNRTIKAAWEGEAGVTARAGEGVAARGI
jgi:ferritin-like metal-binding protein YciE